MFDLSGKVAIVTGGNGGIGLGMARGLASAGARVVVAARNQAKSDAAGRELEKLGGPPLSNAARRPHQAAGQPLVPAPPGRWRRPGIPAHQAVTHRAEAP